MSSFSWLDFLDVILQILRFVCYPFWPVIDIYALYALSDGIDHPRAFLEALADYMGCHHVRDFPLYIKHEDFSEIAHGGQCLSISVLQLWILHLTETSMRAGNSDLYAFLEPQSIQRFGQSQFEIESYIKSWMQSSKRDVYLGAYLNG
ncbi:hypothetical protein GmHk_02G005061 [Glycine max]|nr:hypothetical protein GmHk_02G005061 [Glycine max]